jgi:hypothetical protein
MLKKYGPKYQIAIFLGSIFLFISESYAAGVTPTPDPQLPNIGESVSIQTDNTRALDLSPHIWDRYVRGFRRDHNLNIESGYASSFWIVDKFGDLRSEQYRSRQVVLIGRYTFHILIAGKTGYFLGSSAGYTLADEKKIDDQFQPSPSWLLPGVQTGLVYNYDPSGRIFLGFGAQLERFNDLRTKRSSGEWGSAAMTGESYEVYLGADVFFLLDTAIHFAWSDSTTFFKRPTDADDKLVDVKMKRRSQGASLGLLYHFL